jgi:Holliday junction resolvase RusA-like endonuclease
VTVVSFWVDGVPHSQGSKTARVHNGRAVMREAGGAKLKAWRTAVHDVAAYAANLTDDAPLGGTTRRPDPLWIHIIAVMPRPKSRPRMLWHATTPDKSKILRATEDAIVTGGLVTDDGRIARITTEIRYTTDLHPDSGAYIIIRTMKDQ